MLMDGDYKLISGIGLNIGDSVVKGALVTLHLKKDAAFEDHLLLRPFPRSLPPSIDETSFMDDYRRHMIGAYVRRLAAAHASGGRGKR